MPCANRITVSTPAGPVMVRCKQCLQCRINKQKALTFRALLESRMTFGGEFWTMTYADAPAEPSWNDFSLFMKRFRIWQSRDQGNPLPIRFLACGEYGTKTGRFHYHALIFNGVSPTPTRFHTRLWPWGFVYIGTVTPASIKYTARYTLKFHAKGREAMATWSKRPPLGDVGVRSLARYMLERGDVIESAPTGVRYEGVWYPLDEAMRLAFLSEYTGTPVKSLRTNKALSDPCESVMRYYREKLLGDPLEKYRRHAEERSKFWENTRFTYERI